GGCRPRARRSRGPGSGRGRPQRVEEGGASCQCPGMHRSGQADRRVGRRTALFSFAVTLQNYTSDDAESSLLTADGRLNRQAGWPTDFVNTPGPEHRIRVMTGPREDGAGLIGASRLYLPDAGRARTTHCGSVEAWEALLARSRERPDEFSADVARGLGWVRAGDVRRG